MSTSSDPLPTAATAGDVPPQENYWLPETVVLRLTMFEAGWLQAVLWREPKTLTVCKPDADGKPVETTMPERISEKLWKAAHE